MRRRPHARAGRWNGRWRAVWRREPRRSWPGWGTRRGYTASAEGNIRADSTAAGRPAVAASNSCTCFTRGCSRGPCPRCGGFGGVGFVPGQRREDSRRCPEVEGEARSAEHRGGGETQAHEGAAGQVIVNLNLIVRRGQLECRYMYCHFTAGRPGAPPANLPDSVLFFYCACVPSMSLPP